MSPVNNAMDILKLLPKTNCRECREPTCLVFAIAAFQGKKELRDCPYLSKEVIDNVGAKIQHPEESSDELNEHIDSLKQGMIGIDFAQAARRTGAEYVNGALIIKVFGKDVRIDKNANLSSDIHMHPWIIIPILNYVLNCSGLALTGQWMPMRDLRDGMAWNGLFEQRCEKPLKKILDEHIDLFQIMTQIFNAREVEDDFGADVSIVLAPLVKFPILIRYWKPDDGLESNLNVYFDSTAQDNLDINSIFALGAGLVRMFEKIAVTHGS